jgi:ribosomal protein L29
MANKHSLTAKKSEELIEMLGKQREELRNHRFAAAGSRPADSSSARKGRAQIARILTEQHARVQAADAAAFDALNAEIV